MVFNFVSEVLFLKRTSEANLERNVKFKSAWQVRGVVLVSVLFCMLEIKHTKTKVYKHNPTDF